MPTAGFSIILTSCVVSVLIECGHANCRFLHYPDVLCGKLLIECGHANFRFLHYPDVLCGKCAVRVWSCQLPVSPLS